MAEPLCPSCGELNDDATGTARVPKADDVRVCSSCAAVVIFTGDGYQQRLPTDAERRRALAHPLVARLVGSVLTANALGESITEPRGE